MENKSEYPKELASLKEQLSTMAHKVGVREQFFRRPEGKVGQDVWDLRDNPKNQLRLYCIKLSNVAIILGGGGPKPKGVIKFQELPKLEYENFLMRTVSDALYQRILDKEIKWSPDGCELIGNLIFEDHSLNDNNE